MTPKIDSQLSRIHSPRRSRFGPWSTSITDPHPHMLSRFWKRRIAMLARAPYRNQQSSFFHTLTFALFAIAIFALPMLNIVPVRTLLARDDKPAATSEPEPSESDFSKPILPEEEEEEETPNRSVSPATTVDPSSIEEEGKAIRKAPDTTGTAPSSENPSLFRRDDSFEALVREPDRKSPQRPRPAPGGFGGGGGIVVKNEEEETTIHKSLPPQPEFIPAPTQQEQEIIDKLNAINDSPIDFKEETLQGVADFLKLRFATPIFIDVAAIEEVGLDRDTPAFDLSISNVDGHSILRLLLGRRQLGYCVEDGVLKITSQENLNSRHRLYIYPLADLVHSREDLDEILDAVENTLRVRGMTGVFSINASTRSLIATHSYVSHQEVLNLLRGLRQVAALTPLKPFPATTSSSGNSYGDERDSHANPLTTGGRRAEGEGILIGRMTQQRRGRPYMRVIDAAEGGDGNWIRPSSEKQPNKTSPTAKTTVHSSSNLSETIAPTTTVNGKPVPALPGDPQ